MDVCGKVPRNRGGDSPSIFLGFLDFRNILDIMHKILKDNFVSIRKHMKSFLREFFFLVAVFVAEPIVAINEMIVIFCGKLFHLAVDHLQILVGADLEHIGFDLIACHNPGLQGNKPSCRLRFPAGVL